VDEHTQGGAREIAIKLFHLHTTGRHNPQPTTYNPQLIGKQMAAPPPQRDAYSGVVDDVKTQYVYVKLPVEFLQEQPPRPPQPLPPQPLPPAPAPAPERKQIVVIQRPKELDYKKNINYFRGTREQAEEFIKLASNPYLLRDCGTDSAASYVYTYIRCWDGAVCHRKIFEFKTGSQVVDGIGLAPDRASCTVYPSFTELTAGLQVKDKQWWEAQQRPQLLAQLLAQLQALQPAVDLYHGQ